VEPEADSKAAAARRTPHAAAGCGRRELNSPQLPIACRGRHDRPLPAASRMPRTARSCLLMLLPPPARRRQEQKRRAAASTPRATAQNAKREFFPTTPSGKTTLKRHLEPISNNTPN
jgi:hypothetical protein